jgi:hypothetical protein
MGEVLTDTDLFLPDAVEIDADVGAPVRYATRSLTIPWIELAISTTSVETPRASLAATEISSPHRVCRVGWRKSHPSSIYDMSAAPARGPDIGRAGHGGFSVV